MLPYWAPLPPAIVYAPHAVHNPRMFPKLDVEVKPGLGLGQFELGMSLWTVLDILRNDPHSFPKVDVKYDPDSPTTPVILHLRPHLDLLFSGRYQRLHTISLKKLQDPHPPVTLRYNNMILSSPKEVLRRVGVSRAFGPTYAGEDLRYPGVWFSFEDDSRTEPLRSASPHLEDKMQEVKRVIVCQKTTNDEADDVLSEVRTCEVMHGDLESAIVKVHDGIILNFYPSSIPPVHVQIGITTAQDLICDLGSPIRVHYREDNRMTIHSKSKKDDPEIDSGYFYNYFQHGLDFLISGTTHVVKKIILHTNMPGTALFQRYKRCPWAIEGQPEDDEDDTPPRKWFYDRFESISHFLSPGEVPPTMQLDRTDEEDGLTLPNSTTKLLGFDGVVLEVTESAHVVTVMMF